jgi:hypothetical protein
MAPYSPSTALALTLVLLATITETAYADRFTVTITSGTLSYPVQNSASLRVQFPDGSASIEWDDGLGGDWVPDFYHACCAPGNQLSLSTDESFPHPDGFHFGDFLLGSEIYSVTHFTFAAVAYATSTSQPSRMASVERSRAFRSVSREHSSAVHRTNRR